jgi:hypothetical protein
VSSGRFDSQVDRDVGHLALPLVMIDLQTLAVRSLSVAAARLIGRPADAIVGRPVFELLPASERRHVEEALAGLRDGAMDYFHVRRPMALAPGTDGTTTVWVRVVGSGDERFAVSEISSTSDQRPGSTRRCDAVEWKHSAG